MGVIVNLRQVEPEHTSLAMANPTSSLLSILSHYRDKTRNLERAYALHRKLADKLDVGSMVEAISIWLCQQLPHDLVGFRNLARNRGHVFCSQHGPHRQTLVATADEMLNRSMQDRDGDTHLQDGFAYHLLPVDPEIPASRLLFVHKEGQCSSSRFLKRVRLILDELRAPLDRAMDYEDLYEQARCDALTGLVNRRVFDERAVQEVRNAARYGHPLTLAALDLDHFKAINDQLGHAEGDRVLLIVARTMAGLIRDSDLLARVGGDEFVLLMPNTAEEPAHNLLERLCEMVSGLNIKAPNAPALGVSIGVAAWEKGDCLEAWLENADEALYRAKAKGRSQVSR
jgi:diguanylate cyclase (GGDEF)-like protein